MQRIFQNAKKLISMCLVTVLIVTSAITMLPAPARADNDLVIVKGVRSPPDSATLKLHIFTKSLFQHDQRIQRNYKAGFLQLLCRANLNN